MARSGTRRVRTGVIVVCAAGALGVATWGYDQVGAEYHRLTAGNPPAAAPRVVAPPANTPLPPVSQAARDGAMPRVVRVVGDSTTTCQQIAYGSGWPVATDYIATNAHVVAGADTVAVDIPGRSSLAATVVLFDPERDVAVLHVPNLGLRPFTVNEAAPMPGSWLVGIGYPGGGAETVTPGTLTDAQDARVPNIYNSAEVRRNIMVMDAPFQHGDSGGPLIDNAGRVDGMVFAFDANNAATGYALSIKEIAPDLKTGAASTVAQSDQTGPDSGCHVG